MGRLICYVYKFKAILSYFRPKVDVHIVYVLVAAIIFNSQCEACFVTWEPAVFFKYNINLIDLTDSVLNNNSFNMLLYGAVSNKHTSRGKCYDKSTDIKSYFVTSK